MKSIYYTHDNGGRPFKVEINEDKHVVDVYGNYQESKTYNKKLYSTKYTNIWIGKSPKIEMTLFSGGYGKKFEGNSILVETGNLEYVFIGEKIFSFKSIAPIKTYVSPVGNNDVPYPYAVDSDGYIYLMIENVIIHPNEKTKELFDKGNEPYSVYYKIIHMSDPQIKTSKDEFNYDIVNLVVGDEIKSKQHLVEIRHVGTKKKSNGSSKKKTQKKENEFITVLNNSYRFSYVTNPEKDYERIRRFNKKSGESLYIQTSDNKLIKISKNDYVNINKKWGEIFGLQKMKGYHELVKRM
jgi:hypothetical protein